MKTKVTLVRPTVFLNEYSHPLNIGYLFATLQEDTGFTVDFVDGEQIGLPYTGKYETVGSNPDHTMWAQVVDQILATKPDITAFSCYSMSMTAVNYITTQMRAKGYVNQIWAGGIHPTTCPEETLNRLESLDGVVMSEGEVTFRDLCRRLRDGESISDLRGIAYRDNGEVIQNCGGELVSDMDSLPMPTRTFPKEYSYTEHLILTSRGCPFNCHFCDSKNMWTRKVRYRSGEHVAREIQSIADLGITEISVRDDTFTLSKKHVDGVAKAIVDNGLDHLRYNVGSRIDTMNDDMLKMLKRMNVEMSTFGVETGSAAVQDRIEKGVKIENVIPTIEKTNKAGIRSITFFMLGHPDETEKEMDESVRLIKELAASCPMNLISINTVCPYPGTHYWYKAVEKHGEFIDFFTEGYRYYHQASPFTNITNIDQDTYHHRTEQIKRMVNRLNMKNRARMAVRNPSLVYRKIKKEIKNGLVSRNIALPKFLRPRHV